jgi:hypothetical protein
MARHPAVVILIRVISIVFSPASITSRSLVASPDQMRPATTEAMTMDEKRLVSAILTIGQNL